MTYLTEPAIGMRRWWKQHWRFGNSRKGVVRKVR